MDIVKKTRDIEVVAAEIRSLTNRAQQLVLGYAIEIGRRLCEAKEMLPHGEWGTWLAEKVEYSKSTANNFMRLFQEYGGEQLWLFEPETNSQTLGNLNYTKALKLLAVPAEERESFAEEHDVENISTRELDKLIRERDEALQAAEEARNRADGYAAKLEAQQSKSDKDIEAATAEVERLRAQLKELENRPVDVAVETIVDQAAIEAAREEERKKLKLELNKAEKARTAAVDAKEKAEKALQEAKMAQETAGKVAEKEKAVLVEQVADMRKKLTVAGSSETAIFKVHFEAAQESINKMLTCVSKMEEAEAAKLKNAVSALLKATLAAVE